MKKTVAVVLGAVVGLFLTLAFAAQAAWPNIAKDKQPRAWVMSPKAPTSAQTGSTELHWTVTKGSCIQFHCGNVDVQYLVSASSAPSTATGTGGWDLYAKTTRIMCLPLNFNYISIYPSASATCTVGELSDP